MVIKNGDFLLHLKITDTTMTYAMNNPLTKEIPLRHYMCECVIGP